MKKIYIRGFYPMIQLGKKSVFVLHETTDEMSAETMEVVAINLKEYYPETFRRDKPVYAGREIADEIRSGITTIDLATLYANPLLHSDGRLLKVTNEIADELFADTQYQRSYERSVRRNKVYSLDAEDGVSEAAAIACHTDDPQVILEMGERYCRMCRALNTLPEIQGRRIEAHFLLGKSRKEIAADEGVSESSVNESIDRGIKAMKKGFLENVQGCPVGCP